MAKKISAIITNILAALLLVTMGVLLVWGARSNSATTDELAHIPAGYSYLVKQDMRLNPEHPPLVKDLAALPLLFLEISFPEEHPSWKGGQGIEPNQQWWFGSELLWRQGNPGDAMVTLARLAPIGITLLLGLALFLWSRARYGNIAGFMALSLFAFNPVFLGHGNLVTTDIAAAAGIFTATWALLSYYAKPSPPRMLCAGGALGFAFLSKFSTILLVPFFGILAIAWLILHSSQGEERLMKAAAKIIGGTIAIGVLALGLIYLVYAFHTWHFPQERLTNDTRFILTSFPNRAVADLTEQFTEHPITKPLSWWMVGNLMAFQRSSAGNTGYFLGEISAAGWWQYFPFVYVAKLPIPFHFLTLFALALAADRLLSSWGMKGAHLIALPPTLYGFLARTGGLLRTYFVEVALILFVILYWVVSIRSPLNIGVRHLAPILPLLMFLAAGALAYWIKKGKPEFSEAKIARSILAYLRWGGRALAKGTFVVALIGIAAGQVLYQGPHFLPYVNMLFGGTDNGWRYIVDSNYDWGQDMKRLRDFVDRNDISKIRVDYFGGSDAAYYLGDRFVGYNPQREGPVQGWLAVSATFLQNGRGKPAPGFREPTGYYRWLDQHQPVARAGKSIFIYYIQ